MKIFDEDFTTLEEVASTQAWVKHDASMFDTVCTNVRNYLNELNGSIKDLRKHNDEGKILYG